MQDVFGSLGVTRELTKFSSNVQYSFFQRRSVDGAPVVLQSRRSSGSTKMMVLLCTQWLTRGGA